ncbi:MAG: 23S rRNA (uracil(1939)-C(5))-methyltransferase RlmD [Lachnospiraceae bacterium]|nr:23S rRNA (uracil(1939)-C(5))-methyltransferase RlmD [Lachnospiraceae bacterium]
MNFDAFVKEIKERGLAVYGTEVYVDRELSYSFGDTTGKHYPLYSATKTVLALAVGIAADRGLIDLGRSILDYIPQEYVDGMSEEQQATFRTFTVHRLMTMSVEGFPFRAEGESWLRFALACPIAEPGKKTFSYSNIPAYLVGVALATAIGGDAWQFILDNLLKPLRITDAVYTRCPEGYFYGASGMEMTVNELSRIGFLLYDDGAFEGEQIVSAAYVRRMKAALTPCRESGYGYLLWRYADGNRISGKCAQRCFVLPKRKLVITWLANIEEGGDALEEAMRVHLLGEEPAAKQDTAEKQETASKPDPAAKQEPAVKPDPAVCPFAKKCGGCDYQGVPYAEQLERKQKAERILLDRFCRVEPILGAADPTHYRNKVHGVFGYVRSGKGMNRNSTVKGKVFTGIYEESSHRIVPVRGCMIEDRKATAILQSLCEMAEQFKLKIYDEDRGTGFLRHALIRVARSTGEVMVVLVATDPVFPSKNNFVKELRRRHPEVATVVLNINARDTSMVLGERNIVLYGSGYIEDVLCGLRFRISPSSFYQVNPAQTEVLYQKALEFAGLTGKERVIDAYCGIGTIGMCAAAKAREVIGVELNRDAVRDAVSNAKRNGVNNIRFVGDDAGAFMTRMAADGETADVVFMDPPRSGSTPEFITAVNTLKPARVVYVSCDPETLARDLRLFAKKGWTVERIQPVEMFPYTKHIETVVLLSRKTV